FAASIAQARVSSYDQIRAIDVPVSCLSQVVPPSFVPRMPSSVPIQPRRGSMNRTAVGGAPGGVGEGDGDGVGDGLAVGGAVGVGVGDGLGLGTIASGAHAAI